MNFSNRKSQETPCLRNTYVTRDGQDVIRYYDVGLRSPIAARTARQFTPERRTIRRYMKCKYVIVFLFWFQVQCILLPACQLTCLTASAIDWSPQNRRSASSAILIVYIIYLSFSFSAPLPSLSSPEKIIAHGGQGL